MTFVAALMHDRVEAPWRLKRSVNGDCFRTYVAEVLVPTLRPGDIAVLDNLGSYKRKAVRHAIGKAGAKLLFLPKYLLDLNPVVQLFAKIKHGLRAAAQRSFDTVSATIGGLLATVSRAEGGIYLVKAGYASAKSHPALQLQQTDAASGVLNQCC